VVRNARGTTAAPSCDVGHLAPAQGRRRDPRRPARRRISRIDRVRTRASGDPRAMNASWLGLAPVRVAMSESLVVRPIEDRDWDRVSRVFRAVVAEVRPMCTREPHLDAHGRCGSKAPGRERRALRDVRSSGTAKFGPNRPREVRTWDGSFMVASAARDRRWAGPVRVRNNWPRIRGYAAMQIHAVVSTNVHALSSIENWVSSRLARSPRRSITRSSTSRARHHVSETLTRWSCEVLTPARQRIVNP